MSSTHSPATVASPMPLVERSATPVYNLMVLVDQVDSGHLRARAANLSTDDVIATSVRGALSDLVAAARTLITRCVAQHEPIPWIEPPLTPQETDSRFRVPLHL